MKKTIVALFAHPDDEAFGPSGTIYKLAQENDVYILCATKGEAGQNNSQKESEELGNVRAQELEESATLLGVKRVFFLGFKDGELSNNTYHALAEKIKEKLDELQPEMLITVEPRGVSGHIDHIVVSMVTSYLFSKLDYVKSLYYYCLSKEQRALVGDYFVYFPPGYDLEDISLSQSVDDVWDIKIKAMYTHETQRKDAQTIIARYDNIPKREHFIIINK